MTQLRFISSIELQSLYSNNEVVVIDIRNQDEYKREHILGAHNIPLGNIDREKVGGIAKEKKVVFHCQSGNRTRQHQKQLLDLGINEVYILEKGINDWKSNNGELKVDKKSPFPIMRQVQIIIGFMVILGIILSYFVSPYFNLLSGFFGLGLLFAGITGTCGLANMLMLLPFNQVKSES